MDWIDIRRKIRVFFTNKKVIFASYFIMMGVVILLVALNIAYGWKVGLAITGAFL